MANGNDKPQRIEYEGTIHEFPASFSQQDIAVALKKWDADNATPPERGVAAALKRVGGGLASLPGQVMEAFTAPPTSEEASRMSKQDFVSDIGLGLRRLLIEPSEQLRKSADEPGISPEVANLRRFSSYIPVPVIAPLAENIVERGQLGMTKTPEGDPTGALTELGTYMALPKAAQKAKEVTKAAVGKVLGEPVRQGARGMANVGTGQTKRFVEETLDENAKAKAKAQGATAEKQADVEEKNRTAKEKYSSEQAEYQKAVAQQAEIKQAAQNTGTSRGRLARQTQELGNRMLQRARSVQQATKAKLDSQFNLVREKVGNVTVPRLALASDVDEARARLQGSDESIKVFNDILKKSPEESGPEGQNFSNMNKFLGGYPEDVPATFKDIQGYVSELGEKLSTGTLPGDVFQATKFLQEKLLDRMEKMASEKGVGATLKSARKGYRAYQETFFESIGPKASALAKALRERLPEKAIPFLSGADDIRDIRTKLAQFDPGAMGQGGGAALYDNYIKTLREYEGLPKPAAIAKVLEGKAPEPPTPPKLASAKVVTPDITKVGPAELQQSKRGILGRESQQMRSLGKYDIRLMASSLAGLIPGIGHWGYLAGPLLVISEKLAGVALENPRIVEWLTKPTAADLAIIEKLPADQKVTASKTLDQMSKVAKKQGLRVSPKWTPFIAAGAASGNRPVDAFTPPVSSIPNQNKDGL